MDPERDRVTADASVLRTHLLLVIGDENMEGGPIHSYYPETFLQFHVSAAPPGSDSVAAFAAGIEAANAASRAAGQEMQAYPPHPAPGGPATTLEFSGADDAPERWMAALADRLNAAGFAGEVVPQAPLFPPRWLLQRPNDRGLATFLVMPARITRQDRDSSHLDAVPAGLPEDARDWLLRSNGELLVTVGSFTTAAERTDPFLDTLFDDVAGEYTYASALVTGPPDTHYRYVAAPAQGPTLYAAGDQATSLTEQLGVLREPLLAHAGRAALGFVRRTLDLPHGWMGVNDPYGFPFVGGHEVWVNASLLSRYIPDVHGIQLLTDAHLGQLPGPSMLDSDWTIEPLGAGRHLVTARDLDAWYAQAQPDQETLDTARRVFAPMILTPQVISSRG